MIYDGVMVLKTPSLSEALNNGIMGLHTTLKMTKKRQKTALINISNIVTTLEEGYMEWPPRILLFSAR